MRGAKILICSVSVGTGHTRAAQALKEAWERLLPGGEADICDLFREFSPVLHSLIFDSYLFLARHFPAFYRFLYFRAERDEGPVGAFKKKLFLNGLVFFLGHSVKTYINHLQPEVVVCTHPFTILLLAEMKGRGYVNVPVAGVMTDFIDHPYWVHPAADLYFVPAPEIGNCLVRKGLAPEKIFPLGIPLHRAFQTQPSRRQMKEKLGLSPFQPVALLIGGGLGFGGLEEAAALLLEHFSGLFLLAVAGKNRELQNRLEELSGRYPGRMRVFGFIDNVHELMAAADFAITKPGGLTIAEALARGLPMVFFRPIPGHEERNAQFAVAAGAACWAETQEDLVTAVAELLNRDGRLAAMSQAAAQVGKPLAADHIARRIRDFLAEQGREKGGKSSDAAL